MIKTKQLVMMVVAGAALASATALTSCTSTKAESPRDNVIIGMANPFVDSATLEDAEALVGFSIELPSKEVLPDWVENTVYRSSTVNTKLLEIIYTADESFNKEIRIRKAVTTTDKEDISGDFNDYEKEEIIILDDKSVKVQFNGDKIYLATWTEGTYSYSIRISEGAVAKDFEDFISEIK